MATIGKLGRVVVVSVGLVGLALSGGCGGTGGGSSGNDEFGGTSFVANDQTAGSINLTVLDDALQVGESSHFRVSVRDAQGGAVPNVEIACDTETGLALIEPNTGFEMTDSWGDMSGVIGCNMPGSFRMGCRLPEGAYHRDLVTIHCAGPVPSGFGGFEGAGGGTLGTGNQPSGGTSIGGEVRLTEVVTHEEGQDTSTLDVYRDSCGQVDQNGNGSKTDPCDMNPETFTDTIVVFSVTNTTSERIFLRTFEYSLVDDGYGNPFESNALAFTTGGEIAPNSDTTLTGLFLRAGGSGTPACAGLASEVVGMTKFFTGAASTNPIPVSLGFSNVTFILRGVDGLGAPIEATARVGLSFGNYDNCS